MIQPLLGINDLSLQFLSESGSVQALKNISFNVNRGEIVALVGESGSGKSVTSLSVLQLLPAVSARYTNGSILFSEDGVNTIDLLKTGTDRLQEIRGNKIGMIFQEPMTSLNPVFTCGQQVMETILLHKKVTSAIAKNQTIGWFEKVRLPNPEQIFKRYPHQLSGGQKQRVMISMAMCCDPALLICDEPTTALDVTVQKTILQLIKELQAQVNMGVLFITHDLGVVKEIADRALVMYKGEIVEQNTVQNIFNNPTHPYTRALLECRPVNHKRGERLPMVSDFMDKGNAEKINLPVHKSASTQVPLTNEREPLLIVRDLSVSFPVKRTLLGKPKEFIKAVDKVSLDLYKGETLGLVGESGCGKTTLGRAILRLVNPSSGTISFNGIDLTRKKSTELTPYRKEVQIVFQDPYSSLNPRLTIAQAIGEPLLVHGMISNPNERKEKISELLNKVDLKPAYANRYPHEFSGGQRQRIVIARALAMNPSFIVCDESVSALDVSVQAQVLNLLNELKRDFGFSVLFISHDLSVVRYISDRIMVMNKGKIVETGNADDVYFNPQSEYTRRLIASIPGVTPGSVN